MTLEMVDEKHDVKWTVVRLVGRLDAASADAFKHRVKDLIAAGARHFVCDFAQLRMLSSTGLNALLAIYRELQKHDGELRIANIQSYVREIFDLTGYTRLFQLYDSVDLAIAAGAGE